MTFEARHISVPVDCPPDEVYGFASDPRNLPHWAAGLGRSIENVRGEWVAQSPMGRVKVRFAEPNRFGVLDHDVTLPTGETVANPMRVFGNDGGSELLFTLYRRPGVTAEAFEEDARTVAQDLGTLKALLEGRAPGPAARGGGRA